MGFDFGFGMVLLNLFWTGTGLNLVWFQPLWMISGPLLLGLFLWDFLQTLKERPRPYTTLFRSKSYWPLVFLGLLLLLFSFLEGLVPETFYDSMVYHLAVPAYWLLNHGMRDFPTNFFSNYPFGGEVYFLNGLVFQGTETAKILHVFSFGACALMAGGWAAEWGGEKSAWLTLGLVLTFPLFVVCSWSTAVEGVLSLVLTLFAYSIVRFLRGGEGKAAWALSSGLFCGFAFSVKYTALLAFAVMLVVSWIKRPGVDRKGVEQGKNGE